MIANLSRAFKLYSRSPFAFVWASLLYLFFLLVSSFVSLGLFSIYFIFASALDLPIYESTLPVATIISGVFVVLVFIILANGFHGSLISAYRKALSGQKTSLLTFYSQGINLAPRLFLIGLTRFLIFAVLAGPFIGIYQFYLTSYAYTDVAIGLYSFITYSIVHFLFKPAYMSASAFGNTFGAALKHGLRIIRTRNIKFFGLYFIYGLITLFNLIPIVQLVSFFFLYPVVYSAMISIIERTS